MPIAKFSLAFEGGITEQNLIGAYDAAVALRGFERSLALTTHAVLNGNIIVQAPALKGAEILFFPAERGSWKTTAVVVIGGLWALNNADQHTPVGHLLYSAYDYVIHSATGVELDYDKPIRQLIDEARDQAEEASPNLTVEVLDAVIERSEKSIEEIHRPIVETKTAEQAIISNEGRLRSKAVLDYDTFEYISQSIERKIPEKFEGAVSSYNINSFTGRIFVPNLRRTVPFLLSDAIIDRAHIDKITTSLRANALRLGNETFQFQAIVLESISGRIKRFVIFDF